MLKSISKTNYHYNSQVQIKNLHNEEFYNQKILININKRSYILVGDTSKEKGSKVMTMFVE